MKPPVRHPTQTEDVYEALVKRYRYKDKTGEEAIWLWERDQRITEAKENIRLKPKLKIVQMDNNVFYKEVEYEKEYVKTPDGYFELHMKAKPLGPATVLNVKTPDVSLESSKNNDELNLLAKETDKMAEEVLAQKLPDGYLR